MKKIIFIITTMCFVTLLFPTSLLAQECGKNKPTWATPSYKRTLDNSYLEVVVVSGTDRDQIIEKSRKEITKRRQMTVGEDDAWVKSGHIAEYWECSGNQKTGYFLYQTRSKLNATPEKVVVTDKYPFSARVFVPGMAQIYKGSVGKGAGFIAGEVALIGGVIVSECLRLDYKQKINMTHNSALKQQYANNANACNIARNVCIGGVAAVYIWNIIDGIVAKGKPYVSVEGRTLSFMPFATTDGGGIAMNFTF
jgi:hypothetical protein